MKRSLRVATLAAALGIGLAAAACHRAPPALTPLPAVDTTDLEPSVRAALSRAHAQFDQVAAGKPGPAALAAAYGELGMTYQAQSIVAPAAVAYQDARLLAPDDQRWPYLLGHLYNDASRVPEAIGAFEAALAIDAKDSPTLLSLAEVYLQEGDFAKARTLYLRLSSDPAARAAALAGLGKVAMAMHEYRQAADSFEQALRLAPGSTRLYQPLAIAYRELGERAKAEESLRRFSVDGMEPGIVDPLAEALGAHVSASRALVRRGQRMGKVGRFDLAEAAFRAAVEADPGNADARANLGISLANLGRNEEAQRELARSLQLDDTDALAHMSLGVVLDRLGQDEAAMREYRAALARDPANLQALAYLADATMRRGRAGDAAVLYQHALEKMPDSQRMQLSLAMAEVRAGRFGRARAILESALEAHPEDPGLGNALARVLATSPDAAVRDGARALGMSRALFEATHDPDVGQTYAMALAETGGFQQALDLQRETIIVFEHTGGAARKPFLERNLQRYQHKLAVREGWASDDPVFAPRSPAVQLAKAPPAS